MKNQIKWLETNRLIISHPSPSDYSNFLKLTNNEKVSDYITHGKNPKDIQNVLSWLINHYEVHGFSAGPIYLKDTETFIGRVGLIYQKYNDEDKLCIIYHLLPEYWNKGYASEAVKSVLSYGFNKLNSQKIFALINKKNTSSIKLIEKIRAKPIIEKCNGNSKVIVYEIVNDFYK